MQDFKIRAFFFSKPLSNPVDPHDVIEAMHRVITRIIRAGLLNA